MICRRALTQFLDHEDGNVAGASASFTSGALDAAEWLEKTWLVRQPLVHLHPALQPGRGVTLE